MVWATLCLAIVKRHCNAVWLGSVKQSSVKLLLSNNFFEVPLVNLVGCGMHGRDSLSSIWSNGCLLVGVLAILKLKKFTNEDSLGIGRIGTYISIEIIIDKLCVKFSLINSKGFEWDCCNFLKAELLTSEECSIRGGVGEVGTAQNFTGAELCGFCCEVEHIVIIN